MYGYDAVISLFIFFFRLQLRESMSTSLQKGASSISDIGDAQQILSAAVKLTQEPTELSPTASVRILLMFFLLCEFETSHFRAPNFPRSIKISLYLDV